MLRQSPEPDLFLLHRVVLQFVSGRFFESSCGSVKGMAGRASSMFPVGWQCQFRFVVFMVSMFPCSMALLLVNGKSFHLLVFRRLFDWGAIVSYPAWRGQLLQGLSFQRGQYYCLLHEPASHVGPLIALQGTEGLLKLSSLHIAVSGPLFSDSFYVGWEQPIAEQHIATHSGYERPRTHGIQHEHGHKHTSLNLDPSLAAHEAHSSFVGPFFLPEEVAWSTTAAHSEGNMTHDF